MSVQQVMNMDLIAAVVENDIILESDVDALLNDVKLNVKSILEKKILRQCIIEQLIQDKIITQQAKRGNIIITDAQLDHIISDIAIQHHFTIAQLLSYITYNGMSYEAYRAQLRQALLIAEVRQNIIRHRVTILPQEVNNLAQQLTTQNDNSVKINLSQIIIPLFDQSSLDEIKKAEALAILLIAQSKINDDFSQLAIKYSTNTKMLKYENIICRTLETLPTIFAKNLQIVQNSKVIGPIYSDVGLHIFKVNDISSDNNNMFIPVTEVYARHILLRTSANRTDNQARTKLLEIIKNINSSSISFSVAAKQISEDIISAKQGGDLGWNPLNAFAPAFRDILLSLKYGDISVPIYSLHGWHLIQLQKTREVYNTVHKEEAYRLLLNSKLNQQTQIWMQEQLAATYVKIITHNVQ